MLYYTEERIVFQEVPNEISLSYLISGCPLRCKGCHSAYSWKLNTGTLLTKEYFTSQCVKYSGYITCILFFGGEWDSNTLISLLQIAQDYKYKTCLYTGLPHVPDSLSLHLTYIKVGEWNANLGGLSDPNTNQRFYNVADNVDLTYHFRRNND